jgi:Sensors of blue-light using FAD
VKLVRLIYASHLVAPLNRAGVQRILSAAERHNPSRQITGFLAVSKRYALQCLEGPREGVNEIYNLIARDVRHEGVELLHYSEPVHRTFGRWHMGFSNELSSAAVNSVRWHDGDGLNPYLVESDMIESVVKELSLRLEPVLLTA